MIATLARQARDAGIPVMIVSGDRDVYQLVGDGVRVMTTSRGVTDTKVYDREGVIERYGVPPELVTDFIGLKGDTSDNIPGVPGIGDKTAAQLLQQFGSLEAVLDSVDEISGAKRKQNLTEHADDARVSKQLATMVEDVEVPIDDHRGAALAARPLEAARRRERVRAARRDPAPRRGVGRGRPRAAWSRRRSRSRREEGTPADLADGPDRARDRAAGAGRPATASEVVAGDAADLAALAAELRGRPLVAPRRQGRSAATGATACSRRRGAERPRPRPRHDGRRLPDRSGPPHLRAARARRGRRARRRRPRGRRGRRAAERSRPRRARRPATRRSTRGSPGELAERQREQLDGVRARAR